MDKEYGKVIAKNLKRIAFDNNRTQADLCRDLNLKDSTVSSWFNGTRIPRMDKIDLLTHYFNCSRADIMEPHKTIEFNLNKNGLRSILDILRTVEPNIVYSEHSERIIDLVDKFCQLTEDDQDEIIHMVEYKISKTKEKEKEDLA